MVIVACLNCGSTLQGRQRKWCSESCRVALWRSENPKPSRPSAGRLVDCIECGKEHRRRVGRSALCSSECTRQRRNRLLRESYAANADAEREKVAARRAAWTEEQREVERLKSRARIKALGYTEAKRSGGQRRRALKVGATVEKFSTREIYERDGWVCGICDEPIDRALKHPDPGSVSLDHIQPLSLGGEHSRANTRAAHLGCNVRRGNRTAA